MFVKLTQCVKGDKEKALKRIPAKKIVSLDSIVPIKAYVDFACIFEDSALVLVGWVFDPGNSVQDFVILSSIREKFLRGKTFSVSHLVENQEGVKIVRVVRPDVAESMSSVSSNDQDVDHGFILVIPQYPGDADLAISLNDGRYAKLPFTALKNRDDIKSAFERCFSHADVLLINALQGALSKNHFLKTVLVSHTRDKNLPSAINQPGILSAAIDKAYPLGETGVLLYGWKITPRCEPESITIWNEKDESFDISDHFIPLLRIDVSRHFRPQFPEISDWCGFVCLAPMSTYAGVERALCFDYSELGEFWVKVPIASENKEGERLIHELLQFLPLAQCQDLLLNIGQSMGQSLLVETCLEIKKDEQIRQEQNMSIISCDEALVVNGKALILHGWIGLDSETLDRVELLKPGVKIDITKHVLRTMRPDLVNYISWAKESPAGFLVLLENPQLIGQALKLRVVGKKGERQLLTVTSKYSDWQGIAEFIQSHPDLTTPLIRLLAQTKRLEDDPKQLAAQIATLRSDSFRSRQAILHTSVEQPDDLFAAIDKAYPLGKTGVLLFGWKITPKRKPESITIWNEKGESSDISDHFMPLLRIDVSRHFRTQFPGISDWCGFVCLAPMSTYAGEERALCFDFGNFEELWMKIPAGKNHKSGIELVKEMLGMIPAPDLINHKLYDIFNCGLGRAIEVINSQRIQFEHVIEKRQYGKPQTKIEISVIIPLYGRHDFLRHQLAHFADDPDFKKVEIIYVIDDPSILAPALDMARTYHQLFSIPFQIIWYGQNRGFAGANNIGASVAKGDYLILLNSDVIPKHQGWISTLQKAFVTHPDAGAVGPLLQFFDNTVQHAGMYPRHDVYLPGFLLNTHNDMGLSWEGPDEVSEQPMLTAACLMIRHADYDLVGGLDEGYLIGDFEDSDLCMALRKLGQRLYLVPQAKLWHLERQSQILGKAKDSRQMITLFNGWRYKKKIEKGKIADPNQWFQDNERQV